MSRFVKSFILNPRETGAIAPSSRRLSWLITDTAQLHDKRCVVELGPGTGAFTREIVRKISKDCLFFGLESNREFVKEMRRRVPQATVFNGSAENVRSYLLKFDRKSCDCIVSGLPFASFGRRKQERLIQEAYDSLEEGGIFLTFAYIHGMVMPSGRNLRKILSTFFTEVEKTKIFWVNFPPAFVYCCRK